MLIMLLRGNPSKRQQGAWRNWTSGRPLRKQSGPNQDQTNKMQGSQTKPTPNRIHSSLKRNWQVRNGQFWNFHTHTLWWFCQFAASFVFPGLKTADFLHENLRCGLGRLFQMLGPKVLLEVLHLSPKGLELDDKCAMVMSSSPATMGYGHPMMGITDQNGWIPMDYIACPHPIFVCFGRTKGFNDGPKWSSKLDGTIQLAAQ